MVKRSTVQRWCAVIGAAGLLAVPTTGGAIAADKPRYSMTALHGVQAQLDRDLRIPGTVWSVDEATNTVQIRYTDKAKASSLGQLKAQVGQFGSAVRLEHMPGKIEPLIGGGVKIWPSSGGYCSLGFNAIKDGQYYFFTAGHCTNGSVTWYEGYGQTGVLGNRVTSSYPGRDTGIVKYTNPSVPKPGVIARFDGTVQDITHARAARKGEFVCKAGATSGYTCGHVTKESISVTYDNGETVTDLLETDACGKPGDSGGPLHSGAAALGVVSGGNPVQCGLTWYEKMDKFAGRGINVY